MEHGCGLSRGRVPGAARSAIRRTGVRLYWPGSCSPWIRQIAALMTLILIAALSQMASPMAVSATHYDNTNPGSTPCGDNSHPIQTLRSFYLRADEGGVSKAFARMDIRYSRYCNTVWTRVVNVTGSGAGYASEQSLTANTMIYVYQCPNKTAECHIDDQLEAGDPLPSKGSSAWSLQLTLRPTYHLGSPPAAQPPTIRGFVRILKNGVSLDTHDTELEPLFTRYRSNFANPIAHRDGSNVLSCNNTGNDICEWWGQPGGSSITLKLELDASLSTAPGINLATDLKNVILPAWSQVAPRSPILTWCSSPCTEHIFVALSDPTDPEIGTARGVTRFTSYVDLGAEPLVATKGFLKVNDPNDLYGAAIDFDHSCGSVDDGCKLPDFGNEDEGYDSRPILSHEMGHVVNLGHCDLNRGVMCHVKPSLTNGILEGTAFWTPRPHEIDALKAIYP